MASVEGDGLDLGDLVIGEPLIDSVPGFEGRRGRLGLGLDLQPDSLVLFEPWVLQRPQDTALVDSLKNPSHESLPTRPASPSLLSIPLMLRSLRRASGICKEGGSAVPPPARRRQSNDL